MFFLFLPHFDSAAMIMMHGGKKKNINLIISYATRSGGVNKGVTANGGMHIRRGSPLPTSVTKLAAATRQVSASVIGVREMLTSLGLLCLLSLMMALLGLVFLLKMSPPPDAIHFVDQVRIVSPDEAASVYEVSLALCSLAMTLDVCCCLVCATQLLFAARLITASTCSSSNSSRDRLVAIKSPQTSVSSLSLYPQRASFNIFVSLFLTFGRLVFSIKKFLRDSAVTRICAVAGFFVSIPVFLTGFKNDFRCLLFPLTDPFFCFFTQISSSTLSFSSLQLLPSLPV